MSASSPIPDTSPVFAITFQSAIGLLGALLIWLFSTPINWQGLPAWQAVGWGTVGGLLTFVALIQLLQSRWLDMPIMQDHMRTLRTFTHSFSWPVLVILAVLAGVGEELLFRGFIQGWFMGQGWPWIGILVGAIIFGVVHYLSWLYCLLATGLGLLLGIVYWLTDSLLLVMVWHGVYDLVAIAYIRHLSEQ